MMEVAESAKPVERNVVESSALRDTPVFLMTNTLETGGSERQFALLAHALRAHGVQVELGCIERRGPLVESLPAMPEFRLHGRLYSLRSLGTRVALGRHLRRTGIKVAHAFDFYTNVLLAPVARMAGIRVVLGSHRQVGDLLSPAKFRAQLTAFRFCDRVLCNSQAAADRLIGAGVPGTKLVIVPNMIPQEFLQRAQPLLPAKDGTIRIGMVARMNEAVKRHEFLLDVMAEVVRRVGNLELVLAGDGPLRRCLEEKARALGLADRVMFIGDQRDIPAVLASLDVSVLTSASESRSNAILESMAAGLPVVATDCSGNRELVGHGQSGLLVSADDRAGWVRALEQLATNRELRMQLGTLGRSTVERSCSVSAARDHYERLYSDLLREKSKQATGDGSREPMEEPARILQIGNFPPPLCGWAIQTKFVTEELRRRGHVCEVLKINENRQQRGPEYIDVQNGWDYARKVWRYARRGYRLNVHMNAMGYKGYLLALAAVLAGRACGQPALITFHGGLAQRFFPRHKGSLVYWIYRVLFRLSGGIACDGGLVKDAIERYGLSARQVQDMPGFSPHYLKFEPTPLTAVAEDFVRQRSPLFFCYVAFREEYRLEVVRVAMRKFRERYPGAGFIWLGFPDKELAEAQRWASTWPAKERDGLLLLGNLTHDQFLTLLTRCTAYLRPPACDGVAASVLESIALGVPVVASDNGRRPPGVVTYSDTDAADMCAKLAYVVENLSEVRSGLVIDPAADNVSRMAEWLLDHKPASTTS